MWSIIRKLKFNAVIEGTNQDEWSSLQYVTRRIKIPSNTTVVNDENYQFCLYGRTSDFQTVKPIRESTETLETKISPLVFTLERPRAICTRDGRIYVDRMMLKDKAYICALDTIVQTAKEIF